MMSETLMKTYLELAQILPPDCKSCRELDLEKRIAELEEENKRLHEALTPSGATKYAYSGEFHFFQTLSGYADIGDPIEEDLEVTVPWTTIKDIMAAIKSRAKLEEALTPSGATKDARIAELEEENKRLREALEPFALISSEGVIGEHAKKHVSLKMVAQYFHSAHSVLSKGGQ